MLAFIKSYHNFKIDKNNLRKNRSKISVQSNLSILTIIILSLFLLINIGQTACPLSYLPKDTTIGFITAQINNSPILHDKFLQFIYPLKDPLFTVPKVSIAINQLQYQNKGGILDFGYDVSFTPAGGFSNLMFLVKVDSQSNGNIKKYPWKLIKFTFISTTSDLFQLNIFPDTPLTQISSSSVVPQNSSIERQYKKYQFGIGPALPAQTLVNTKVHLFLSGIKITSTGKQFNSVQFYVDSLYKIQSRQIRTDLISNTIKGNLFTQFEISKESLNNLSIVKYFSVSIIVYGQDLFKQNLLLFNDQIDLSYYIQNQKGNTNQNKNSNSNDSPINSMREIITQRVNQNNKNNKDIFKPLTSFDNSYSFGGNVNIQAMIPASKDNNGKNNNNGDNGKNNNKNDNQNIDKNNKNGNNNQQQNQQKQQAQFQTQYPSSQNQYPSSQNQYQYQDQYQYQYSYPNLSQPIQYQYQYQNPSPNTYNFNSFSNTKLTQRQKLLALLKGNGNVRLLQQQDTLPANTFILSGPTGTTTNTRTPRPQPTPIIVTANQTTTTSVDTLPPIIPTPIITPTTSTPTPITTTTSLPPRTSTPPTIINQTITPLNNTQTILIKQNTNNNSTNNIQQFNYINPFLLSNNIQINRLPIIDFFVIGLRGLKYTSNLKNINFKFMISDANNNDINTNIKNQNGKQTSTSENVYYNPLKSKFQTFLKQSQTLQIIQKSLLNLTTQFKIQSINDFNKNNSVKPIKIDNIYQKTTLQLIVQSFTNNNNQNSSFLVTHLTYFSAQRRTSYICKQCQNSNIAFQSFCIEQCPFGYIQKLSNSILQCQYCNITKLYIPNQNNNQCVCANQHFQTISSGQNVCKPCHYTCLTCQDQRKNRCLTCDTKQNKTKRQLSNKRECLCPLIGYYDDSQAENLICQKCHSSCKTCQLPKSQQQQQQIKAELACLQCSQGRIKNKDGLCVCTKGFTTDKITGGCICGTGKIQLGTGQCSIIPSNRLGQPQSGNGLCNPSLNQVFNPKINSCQCSQNSYYIDGHCQKCKSNQIFDKKTNQCICNISNNTSKLIFKNSKTDQCVQCSSQSQKIDYKNQKCICKNNYIRNPNNNNKCQKCPYRSQAISQTTCQCVFNYYFDIKTNSCKRCIKKSDGVKCLNVQ